MRRVSAATMAGNISQMQLADADGLSVDAIRNYENERRMPDRNAGLAIARVLGRAFEDIYDENPPPPDPAKLPPFRVTISGEISDDIRERLDEYVQQLQAEERRRRGKTK